MSSDFDQYDFLSSSCNVFEFVLNHIFLYCKENEKQSCQIYISICPFIKKNNLYNLFIHLLIVCKIKPKRRKLKDTNLDFSMHYTIGNDFYYY